MPFAEMAHVPRGESGFSKPPRTIEYRANCVVFSQRGKPVLGSGSRSSGDKSSAMNSPTRFTTSAVRAVPPSSSKAWRIGA